jgi:hypothetical protein
MRQPPPQLITKTHPNPLRARQHVRPAQPRRQIDHQKDLVEHRPQPGHPNALQPINERQGHHPHRPRNVEHPRRVRQTQHVPRKRLASEKVGFHAPRRPPPQGQSNDHHRQQVKPNNDQIDTMQCHTRDLPNNRPQGEWPAFSPSHRRQTRQKPESTTSTLWFIHQLASSLKVGHVKHGRGPGRIPG